MSANRTHGFTLVELVVVLIILAVLLMILWPIFRPMHCEHSLQTTCLSQVRQMATACQMYNQDNKCHFPGSDWVNEITTYLGSSEKMFWCPLDENPKVDPPNSYGYSGLLVRPDGSGVKENDILSPTEVGVICDAAPDKTYPTGGLVYGGALLPSKDALMTPAARHSNGTVVSYADGHAKYVPNGINERDIANGVNRAFVMAGALGLVDNPAGGISDFPIGNTLPDGVTVGGEPCTRTILLAAAAIWRQRAKAPIAVMRFKGQFVTADRGKCYLWGIGDGLKPAGNSVAIARDEVVVIVAKHTKIPMLYQEEIANPNYVMDYNAIRNTFGKGVDDGKLQAYTFDTHSGTRRFFSTRLGENGKPLQFGKGTRTAKDDIDMVDKVANDPYGIGYCSSAIADPERVAIVALQAPDGKVYRYPNDDEKSTTLTPDQPNSPLTRILYAACGGNAWSPTGTGIANVMLAPNAEGTKALQAGPLFKASYFKP